MKKILLVLLVVVTMIKLPAQNYAGFNSGNYAGVNSVFFNPASISDSRYRWDINLLSVHAGVLNNYAKIKSADMFKLFSADSLSKYFTRETQPNVRLMTNVDIFGPSVLFNASEKNSFAITTRLRNHINLIGLDGSLLNLLENKSQPPTAPVTLSQNGVALSSYSWSEIGLSYSRPVIESGVHFIKVGLTLKYLSGLGAGFLTVNNLQGTLGKQAPDNPYIKSGTGNFNYGFTGKTGFALPSFSSSVGSGIGTDFGLVYELRPNLDKYKVSNDELRKDKNKYVLRLGIALKDMGSIKFNKVAPVGGVYKLATSANTGDTISLKRFYGIGNFEDLNTAMMKATPSITKTGSVGNELIMQLPSTLALDLDLNVGAGFFLNVAGSFMLKNSDQDYQVAGSYNYFQITPRFESKGFGIYLPITHNAINNYNAGIALNLGSLFIGSGSLLSTFISGETRQLDIHAGFRFGLLQQKNETNTKTKKKEETIE